jgi:hypothetical protein
MLQIFIVLKNPSPVLGLNPRTFGHNVIDEKDDSNFKFWMVCVDIICSVG